MEFKKYMKVRRLGVLENEGILDSGTIYIFEKLDGSNAQIRNVDEHVEVTNPETGEVEHKNIRTLKLGSRNRWITKEDGQFAAFYDWAHKHPKLCLLEPEVILFGEWLVPHTVKYEGEHYGKFYLFDVYDIAREAYLPYEDVEAYAKRFDLNLVKPWFVGTADELTDFMAFVGKSDFGSHGEGIVIKNYGYRNLFGHQCHAKVVAEKFREDFAEKTKLENNDQSTEKEILATFVNEARVRKFLNRAKSGEIELPNDLTYAGDMRDMRWLPHFVYEDIIDEEAHYICRNVKRIDFDIMKRRCGGFVAPILKRILAEDEQRLIEEATSS